MNPLPLAPSSVEWCDAGIDPAMSDDVTTPNSAGPPAEMVSWARRAVRAHQEDEGPPPRAAVTALLTVVPTDLGPQKTKRASTTMTARMSAMMAMVRVFKVPPGGARPA